MEIARAMKLTRDLLERLVVGFQGQYDGLGDNVWIYNPKTPTGVDYDGHEPDLYLLSEKEEWLARDLLREFGYKSSMDAQEGTEILKLTLNFCKVMLKDEKIQ